MNIKENYQKYANQYASELTALKRKNTGFITGELLAFGGILSFLICYFACDGDTRHFLVGAVLCLAVYFIIRRIDDRHKEKIEQLAACSRSIRMKSRPGRVTSLLLKQADSI